MYKLIKLNIADNGFGKIVFETPSGRIKKYLITPAEIERLNKCKTPYEIDNFLYSIA